jgi:hypothetical protein
VSVTVTQPVAPEEPSPARTRARFTLRDGLFALTVVVGAVLRLVDLGRVSLTPDETFSAYASHLPLGQISGVVRTWDPHPPLSYWLLHPISRLTTSTATLRLPAALCSVAALVVMAVWQRHRGVAGLAATAVFAIAPFNLAFGREVRMYGLVQLLGVVMAWAAFRWAEGDHRPRWVLAATAAGLALALSHGSGVILLAALILLPGLRRDRDAWVWRAALGGALALFLLYWGAAMTSRSGWASTYPPLSVQWVLIALNEGVAAVPSQRYLVVALLAAGVVAALVGGGALRRLMIVGCLVPLAVMLAASTRTEIFGPKSFVMLAWAPALALGALIGVASTWRPVAGAAVAALLVVLVVPYIGPTMSKDENLGPMIAAVSADRRDGDGVAIRQAALGHVFQWYLGVVDGLPEHALHLDVPDSRAFVFGRHAWNGRVWLAEAVNAKPVTIHGASSCAPPRTVGAYHVRCIQFGPPRNGG